MFNGLVIFIIRCKLFLKCDSEGVQVFRREMRGRKLFLLLLLMLKYYKKREGVMKRNE